MKNRRDNVGCFIELLILAIIVVVTLGASLLGYYWIVTSDLPDWLKAWMLLA